MDEQQASRKQQALVEALGKTLRHRQPVPAGQPAERNSAVRLVETNLSRVLIAGGFAYKFKKPFRFDFVDYSTLERRRYYCEQELRLNRRLAPHLYLGVVAVRGTPEHPRLAETFTQSLGEENVASATGEHSAVLEYAVKMRAFDQHALWSHRLAHGLIAADEIDQLGSRLAAFHRSTAVSPADSRFSSVPALRAIAMENFDAIASLAADSDSRERIRVLRDWEAAQRRALQDSFIARKKQGFIRECHGDLHCGNILTIDGQVSVFDCIEFNEGFRWIDVMNDLAFACMDIAFRGKPDFAARLLNRYLEASDDHGGLAVLRYYGVVRALVRCKVAWLLASQLPVGSAQARDQRGLGAGYLEYAIRRAAPRRPTLVITHGFSGSGKTTLARALAEAAGAIQLRSDIERKRLRGLASGDRSGAAPGSPLYDADATRQTYARLGRLARQAMVAGYSVIVDAAFLKAEQRNAFRRLADELGVPLRILDIRAPQAVLRERIAARQAQDRDASDAGLEVLALQLANDEPLSVEETAQAQAVVADMGGPLDDARVRAVYRELF